MNKVYTKYHRMLCALYSDVASVYPAQYRVEQQRDLDTIECRFHAEGVAFLTKTLPSLGKALDKALSKGTIFEPPSFARKKGNLPGFLGWLIGYVFDSDGRELPQDKSPEAPRALMHLRQLLYLFYKLEMPYSDSQIQDVLDTFESVDAGLGMAWHIREPLHKLEIKFARSLICRVLGDLDPRGITPGHGPGSVATGETLDNKAYFKRDYQELTSYYSLDEYFYLNYSHQEVCLTDKGLQVRCQRGRRYPWENQKAGTAKVVLVPKDSRGPRLISMEPLEYQWIQQGQCKRLVSRMESHWLTRGHINFQSQDINRYLAWIGSMPVGSDVCKTCREHHQSVIEDHPFLSDVYFWTEGVSSIVAMPHPEHVPYQGVNPGYVTLDMKEASDRVSVAHIVNLFPDNWVEALMASRSPHTKLPSGKVIALNKFAPMGSAVCFPVEALVFWALSLASIRYHNPMFVRRNTNKQLLRELSELVWVYGDDIVCRFEDYGSIEQSLERTGLLLNVNKCCTQGSFRESCGMDAYRGSNVTPLRIKKCVGHHLTGQLIMSYVSYSNDAYERGYTNLADVLERIVSSQVPIPFTTVDRGLVQFVRPAADVRTLNARHRVKTRFNRKLHVLEAYGPTPSAVVSKHHNVTHETYFSRVVSRFSEGDGMIPPESTLVKKGRTLEADQYSLPRRVSSKRGWTQITV